MDVGLLAVQMAMSSVYVVLLALAGCVRWRSNVIRAGWVWSCKQLFVCNHARMLLSVACWMRSHVPSLEGLPLHVADVHFAFLKRFFDSRSQNVEMATFLGVPHLGQYTSTLSFIRASRHASHRVELVGSALPAFFLQRWNCAMGFVD